MSTPLSVVVLTLNEERNLPACLTSLEELRCEILVVDSGSTDRTGEIARRANAVVLEHPFEHYGAQRNWAQANLPFDSDWILHLDADERLTPELVREMNQTLAEDLTGINGFLLRKRTIFMGRWIRHGGHFPSYHSRLFRRAFGRCEDRLYDQHFLVEGRVDRLHNDYLDVLTSDITTWAHRHVRWAELEAKELISAAMRDQVQPSFFGDPIQRRRWLRTGPYAHAPLFLRAFLYFAYRYIVRFGFLDGREGLIFHFLQGCWYRFMVDVMLEELRGNLKSVARS